MNPAVTAFSFLLAVAFVPGYTGAAIPTGWTVLSLGLPLLLLACKVPLIPPNWWGLAFLIYAFAICNWTYDSILALWQLCTLACAFALGSALKDLRHVFIGLSAGLAVSAGVAVAQRFGYSPMAGLEGHASGLFFNQNILAETAFVVLVGALALRLYYLMAGPGLALAVSYDRATVVAGAVLVAVLLVPKRWCLPLAGLALIGGASALALLGPSSALQRIELWQDALSGMTLLGSGPGSFYTPRFSHVHNDFLEFLFEYGIGTIPLWICLILLLESDHALRFVLIGAAVIALFSFPLHYPVSGFVVAVTAGHLARRRYLVCDDSVLGRSALSLRVENPQRGAPLGGKRPLPVQPTHTAFPV